MRLGPESFSARRACGPSSSAATGESPSAVRVHVLTAADASARLGIRIPAERLGRRFRSEWANVAPRPRTRKKYKLPSQSGKF